MVRQGPGTAANPITNRWSMDNMADNRAIRKLEDVGAISRTKKSRDKRELWAQPIGRGRK